MIIDANMYFIPEVIFQDETLLNKFLEEVPEHDDWHGKCINLDDGRKQIVLEKPEGCPNLNYVQGEYTVEGQCRDLDIAGADKAILKVPGCLEWMSLNMCKFFNDKMYEHFKDSNGRLVPLAVVDPRDAGAAAELARCKKDYGMNAFQLSAHYGDKYLDDAVFADFFEKANELKLTAYIHHTPIPPNPESFMEYDNVRRSLGRIVDQALAVSRELYSGFFDKYPNLKFVHLMMGGGYFGYANLMMPHGGPKGSSVKRFSAGTGTVKHNFKNNIYFEMSHAQPWGKEALEAAVKILGADKIVFGSSYPVKTEWLTEGVNFVKALDITDEEKKQILGDNASRLYMVE